MTDSGLSLPCPSPAGRSLDGGPHSVDINAPELIHWYQEIPNCTGNQGVALELRVTHGEEGILDNSHLF